MNALHWASNVAVMKLASSVKSKSAYFLFLIVKVVGYHNAYQEENTK